MLKLNPLEIKSASYNPRIFTKENENALEASMDEFSDISGITFNTKTGNLITGHHRWKRLCEKHGIQNLELEPIENTDRFLIKHKEKGHLGFLLRVVEWDIDKEKMANITANSPTVRGKFTDGLQDILNSVSVKLEKPFKDLKLDELKLDIKKPTTKTPITDSQKPKKKSETLINAGGESYVTVKLELTPKLAERLHDTIERFKTNGSVEKPLKMILDYVDLSSKEDIIKKVTNSKKRRRRKN